MLINSEFGNNLCENKTAIFQNYISNLMCYKAVNFYSCSLFLMFLFFSETIHKVSKWIRICMPSGCPKF